MFQAYMLIIKQIDIGFKTALPLLNNYFLVMRIDF